MSESIPLQSSCCIPARQSEASDIELMTVTPAKTQTSTQNMVFLKGGTFLMGAEGPETWKADGEGPVREVTLDPFWIDIYAVTNAQFAKFIDETGYKTEAENFGWSYVFYKHVSAENKSKARGVADEINWWLGVNGAFWRKPEGPGSDLKKREDHPVVHISWNDAQAYCQWAGKSLPTEAQWEYAARGGLESQLYPWGNELQPKDKKGRAEHRCNIWQGKFPTLNTGADGFVTTAPVKTFTPNGYGIYQTSGNTWEWCSDWFSRDFHLTAGRENPAGPERGTNKIIKGGSFLCHASYCNRYRVAARTSNTPDSTTSHTGFRCVYNG